MKEKTPYYNRVKLGETRSKGWNIVNGLTAGLLGATLVIFGKEPQRKKLNATFVTFMQNVDMRRYQVEQQLVEAQEEANLALDQGWEGR